MLKKVMSRFSMVVEAGREWLGKKPEGTKDPVEELLNDVDRAQKVEEASRHTGFQIVVAFNNVRKEQVRMALLYNSKIDQNERIILQGELIGLEAFEKTFDMTVTAGVNARRVLEEMEKAQHGTGRDSGHG